MAEVSKLQCLKEHDKIHLLNLCFKGWAALSVSIVKEASILWTATAEEVVLLPLPLCMTIHSVCVPRTGSGPGMSFFELIELTKLGEKMFS